MHVTADADISARQTGEALRGYLEYLRDLGVYDLYRNPNSGVDDLSVPLQLQQLLEAGQPTAAAIPAPGTAQRQALVSPVGTPAMSRVPARPWSERVHAPAPGSGPEILIQPSVPSRVDAPAILTSAAKDFEGTFAGQPLQDESYPSEAAPFAPPAMPLVSFNQLAPLPSPRITATAKADALKSLRTTIGDCTRCPLAYAGRHSIVFANGDPNARLMFVGEGPGADEDTSGVPFVGKAGQLLNNMIGAMGLKREAVYIANIVMCRPPKNRAPEPVEANTCTQFLLQQIDIVQPAVIVALGATAAMYLLGVRRPLSALRGQWHDVRGAKCAVTYHPAFLLRDPRQKGEAWKDLQRVMVELDLKPPARA